MQKIVKFPLFLALLLGAVLATSCDRKDIHQVISLMTETPTDTTGFAQKDVRMSSFSAVVVDCFADVSFFQTAPEESPRVVLMAQPTFPTPPPPTTGSSRLSPTWRKASATS